MNRIYWDEDQIGMLTNQINAKTHKHWMMQLFLGIEEELHIAVNGNDVVGRCIIVNQNIEHAFSCEHKIHFSSLIFPTSPLAIKLHERLNKNDYYVLESAYGKELGQVAGKMIESSEIGVYEKLLEKLNECFKVQSKKVNYDERVKMVLNEVRACDCSDHSIEELSKKLNLSSSRLAHLFREQIGMPLKSYILLHQMTKVFELLFSGESITTAAMRGGFDSPSHFAATTKKMMGMPASLSLKDSGFLKVSSLR